MMKKKEKRKKKKGRFLCSLFLIPFSLFSIFFSLPSAHAADPNWKDIVLPSPKPGITDLASFIQVIITWLLGLGGALAVFAIIYSGIMYMTAGADETKAEAAKKNLVWAITGLIIILLAFVIIAWVSNVLS